MLMLSGSLIIRVATAFHCTVFTATTTRGFTLFLVSYAGEYYGEKYCRYNKSSYDCRDIPFHFKSTLVCVFVLSDKKIDKTYKCSECDNRSGGENTCK